MEGWRGASSAKKDRLAMMGASARQTSFVGRTRSASNLLRASRVNPTSGARKATSARRKCIAAPPVSCPAPTAFHEWHAPVKCKATTDCGTNVPCINGTCLPRTLGFPFCDPSAGECVTCEDGVGVEGTSGKKCSFSGNCFLGMACRGGRCTASKAGDMCSFDYNCAPPARCHVGKCVHPGRV